MKFNQQSETCIENVYIEQILILESWEYYDIYFLSTSVYFIFRFSSNDTLLNLQQRWSLEQEWNQINLLLEIQWIRQPIQERI